MAIGIATGYPIATAFTVTGSVIGSFALAFGLGYAGMTAIEVM